MSRGFLDDTSSETQARRARLNKGKSPWRNGPNCSGKKARARFDAYHKPTNQKKP